MRSRCAFATCFLLTLGCSDGSSAVATPPPTPTEAGVHKKTMKVAVTTPSVVLVAGESVTIDFDASAPSASLTAFAIGLPSGVTADPAVFAMSPLEHSTITLHATSNAPHGHVKIEIEAQAPDFSDGFALVDLDVIGTNGSLDKSFGGQFGAGSLTLIQGAPSAIATLPSGKIVIAATSAQREVLAIELNQDGSLDTSFGVSGVATISGAPTVSGPMAVGTDGRFAIAVLAEVNGGGEDIPLYDTPLAIVTSSADGHSIATYKVADWSALAYVGTTLYVSASNKLLQIADDNVTTTPLSLNVQAMANIGGALVATMPNETKRLAAPAASANSMVPSFFDVPIGGVSLIADANSGAIVIENVVRRIDASGTVDTAFGTNGGALVPFGVDRLVAGPSGQWFIAYETGYTNNVVPGVVLTRFSIDGSRDDSFGDFGLSVVTANVPMVVIGAAFDGAGRLWVAGTNGGDTQILRYRVDP